jgi:2-dehydro-3-deoxygluconokinase
MQFVTFGEIMMRLSAPDRLRFSQARSLDVTYGGAEATVAISLANFGLPSRYVTKLPNNPFGDGAVCQLREHGVDTTCVLRGGDRIGVYFVEPGASQRPPMVVYDRANSAISQLQPGELDWGQVFSGASWFHVSGITPALGPILAAETREACRAAKAAGMTVSCDVNFRKKLWTYEQARETLTDIMPMVDVAINPESVRIFGCTNEPNATAQSSRAYEREARAFSTRFGAKTVAITIRDAHSADNHSLSAMLLHEDEVYRAQTYDMHIVDRVGGGDAFTGGLIYSLATGKPPQESIEFAVAAGVLKHSVHGDASLFSVAEVEALAKGGGSAKIQR